MRDPDQSILAEAQRLVYGDRAEQYGDAKADLERIAAIWTVLLTHPVRPHEVAMCMVALKLSRLCHRIKRDSWVDVAGWADVGAQLGEEALPLETRADALRSAFEERLGTPHSP